MRVIAYAYNADHHCEDCTVNMLWNRGQPYMFMTYSDVVRQIDIAKDSEGNPLHPVFSIDEWYNIGEGDQVLACTDCGKELDSYAD